MSSYAVIWSESDCGLETGKLELDLESIRFECSHCARGGCVHRVYYDDIDAVRIGHHKAERLAGKPAVVVDLDDGGSLRIGSVNGLGAVAELADELTKLAGRAA
jgi:hypothetical protein